MRKAIVAALVIVAILVALPQVFGLRTESMIRGRMESMNEYPVYSFEVESYERRWFSSAARVAIGIDEEYLGMMTAGIGEEVGRLGQAILADLALDVVLEIDHGPVVLDGGLFLGLSRIQAQLDEDSAVITEIRKQLAMPYLVRLNGEVGFLGAFDFVVNVPPIDYAYEAGDVSFSGATTEGTLRGRRLTLDGNVDSLTFATPQGTASILGMSVTTDNEFVATYFATGDAEFGIDSIVVGDAFGGPEPIFAANNLRITTSAQLDDTDSLLSAQVVYGAESVKAATGQFDLADVELGIRVDNFHLETLKKYYDSLFTISVATDPEALIESLQTVANEALAHEPSIALDPIRFRLFDESFDANMTLRPSAAAVQNGIDFENPISLVSAFEATANATASKVLAERLLAESLKLQLAAAMGPDQLPPGQDIDSMARTQAQLLLATSLGQGFIVEDGDSYTATIEYAGAQVTINGNPLPLGMF